MSVCQGLRFGLLKLTGLSGKLKCWGFLSLLADVIFKFLLTVSLVQQG